MTEKVCPAFDITDPELAAHPWEMYASLRAESPVARGDKHGGYWAITRWADVRQAAKDQATFCSAQGATIPRTGLPVPGIPVESDPPDHHLYRMLLLPLFRPDKVAAYRAYIENLSHRLIDAFADDGEADLVGQFARRLPPRVIARLAGIPEDHADIIVKWPELMRQSAVAGEAEANAAAAGELSSYLLQRLAEKRAGPSDDILSLLAHGMIDARPIGEPEALGIMLTLVTAGFGTTVNGISSALYLLGTHPEARQALIEDRSLMPAAIEEILRIESPVQMMARTATRDVAIGDVSIAAGDKVGLLFGSANHDEKRFPEADAFEIQRSPNPHLAFGFGAHRCLGEHLARLEMDIALSAILDRLPDYELADPAALRWTNSMNRGLTSLPVRFPPAG